MARSKRFSFAIVVLGCCPLMVHAADPSTQPSTGGGEALDVSIESPEGGMTPGPAERPTPSIPEEGKPHRGDRLRAALRYTQPYSDKERADAMLFMSQHSPQRYKFISAMPDGEKKTGIQNFAIRAYQSWMQLGKENFPLYAVVLKRVEKEDEIFGLASDLRDAPADKQSMLTADLHDKVESLVDIGIKERQMRLDDLSRTLKDEQDKLAQDTADRKSLVEKRMKAILSDDHLGRKDFK